jgi:outer membrane receptor protein involved in Fe transport
VRTFLRVFLVCFAILLPAAVVAQDQSSVTGSLNGTVTDSTGAAIPGAAVAITGPQGTVTTHTDNLGRFTASTLHPGYYDVKVTKAGFAAVEAKHNEVTVSVASTLTLTMGVGSESTTVEVSAAAVQIDTQNTAITSNLTDTFYNSVPMQRNVSAIFYAAPGVEYGQVAGTPNQAGPGQANPSIGGASALENLYVVDGVTITDQAFGSIGTFNRYHGSLGTGINLAFVKEVDVKTTAFEPQYGKATGGIVQIVTAAGGDSYHGGIAAYFAPSKFYAARYQFAQFGYKQLTPSETFAQPAYDVAATLGGYIPGLKDKLFFFGAFDPSLSQNYNAAAPGAPAASVALGVVDYNTTAVSWAGKLTYKLGSRTTLEGSSFGDPSRHNAVPNTLSAVSPIQATSSYNYGSRDSVLRLDSALTNSWTVDLSYAYNHNHFSETPKLNVYGVTNDLPTYSNQPATASGFGAYEPSLNNTYSIAANTSKIFHLFHGQHTVSIGYAYDHTDFVDEPSRSGSLFAIPTQNAANQTLTDLYSNIPAGAPGALTNATFTIAAANPNNLGDTTCTQCPVINGVTSYASISRGTYVGLFVNAFGRYHAAYGEDNLELNRFVTMDLGVRWENQRVGGDLLNYSFGPSWSPRLGINIDPTGKQKSKLFFNYGRNFWAMPLDAAIRQLGNEQDDTSYAFVPVQNSDGTFSVLTDAAHTLNGLPQAKDPTTGVVSNFGGPNFSSSTGEGILPGTKQEYEDEYVAGVESNIGNSLVLKARYTDRRLGRIIEDIGSQSPEGSQVDGAYAGGITNPGPGTDIATNENEVTYTPAQFFAANPNGAQHSKPATTTSPAVPEIYNPVLPGCTQNNDTYFAVSGGFFRNSYNQQVGGACILNQPVAGKYGADGIPDGFVKPIRRYNAVELELIKRFNNHWLADVNLRWGNLWGNYEGAYRNDNGQSDPGISSLFDFTAGKLGLLGDQFTPGYLSTDRRAVGSLFLSYSIGSDTPFVHALKGLQTGAGLRGQSGVPLSLLGDHPIYLNQGEIPIGGRGAAGRTPSASELDLHLSYPVPLGSHWGEKYNLKLAMDMFNVTNSQFETGRDQYTQVGNNAVGAAPPLNADYNRPTSFQNPFYARGTVAFEF